MLSKAQLDRRITIWHRLVKQNGYCKKNLKIDRKMCRILLSNSVIYGKTTFGKYNPLSYYRVKVMSTKIGSRTFSIKARGEEDNHVPNYCWGNRHNEGYFAHEVSKMKYLSEFLATLPAFVVRRGY